MIFDTRNTTTHYTFKFDFMISEHEDTLSMTIATR